jgi:hypothetical protein
MLPLLCVTLLTGISNNLLDKTAICRRRRRGGAPRARRPGRRHVRPRPRRRCSAAPLHFPPNFEPCACGGFYSNNHGGGGSKKLQHMAHCLMDLYGGLVGHDSKVDEMFFKLKQRVAEEAATQNRLFGILGMVEMVIAAST